MMTPICLDLEFIVQVNTITTKLPKDDVAALQRYCLV